MPTEAVNGATRVEARALEPGGVEVEQSRNGMTQWRYVEAIDPDTGRTLVTKRWPAAR